MKLSRKFSEILSSESTLKRLLHPVVVLQSPLYSTTTTLSSKAKSSKSIKKHENPEIDVSELKEYDEDLGFPFDSKFVQKNVSSTRSNLPRPSEIPWQAKVANSVNLIGSIAMQVQFQESPDGKFWAGTILSQDKTHDSTPLWIPIIFEGDLAHVAACHLKEKDLVHVSGNLSGDPPQISVERGHSSIQVMVRSINFVQESSLGKDHYAPYKADKQVSSLPVDTVKDRESVGSSWRDLVESSWRDLVDNPTKWWDYRANKLNGSVKPKYPDFKHKENGKALWLDSAPKWVLPEIEVPSDRPIIAKSTWGESKGKSEESWKKLIENPEKWWDNRSNKINPKSPDFKHKETGEALWLSSSPAWVQDQLPTPKPNVAMSKRDTLLS